MDSYPISSETREALKQELFSSLHCALPGKVISFDAETRTAEIQPAVKLGSLMSMGTQRNRGQVAALDHQKQVTGPQSFE